jgi:hypothetical protein
MANKITQYIYLIHTREFYNHDEFVYKIGKTKKLNFHRFNQYPRGSVLLFQTNCNDCDICETKILKLFNSKYKRRKDIGLEYFEGDYKQMKKDICNIVDNNVDVKVEEKIEKKEEQKIETKIVKGYNEYKLSSEQIKEKVIINKLLEKVEELVDKVENIEKVVEINEVVNTKIIDNINKITKEKQKRKVVENKDDKIIDRTCNKCNTIFNYPCNLIVHLKNSARCKNTEMQINDFVSNNIKKYKVNFICENCNETFTRKLSLQRHVHKSSCNKVKSHIHLPT